MPAAIRRDGIVVAPVALCLALVASAPPLPATLAAAAQEPSIDRELREQVRAGRRRVLVELRVAWTPRAEEHAAAIMAAQRTLLDRLAGLDVLVARRYTAIPYLALEIDAAALAALERMGDLVVRVVADRPARLNQ